MLCRESGEKAMTRNGFLTRGFPYDTPRKLIVFRHGGRKLDDGDSKIEPKNEFGRQTSAGEPVVDYCP